MHIDQLLLQIGVVLLVGRFLTRLIRKLGQPAVIGEIVTGIALGPSLLGALAPGWMAAVFPADSMAGLGTVAQLGLVFFMFLVGLEFDPRLLAGRARAALVISGAGILVPLVSGVAVALALPADLSRPGVPVTSFALFVGVAMSVTAFPVLARILTERRLVRTPVGAMALAAAAVDDVAAWSLLAVVVGIVSAAGPWGALTTVGLTLAYAGAVWFLVRPLLARIGPREGSEVSVELTAAAVLLVVASAWITEHIGVHALFGGFLVGAAMPRTGGLSTALSEKMEDFVTIVLLPLFFAYSGLRTQMGLLSSAEDWALTAGLLFVATAGKFGGSALAARWTGLGAREAAAVGVLMNTRGLMEIVVLNVGLDIGVVSERMFAMMVIVAVVTTWITTPVLRRIYSPALQQTLHHPPTPEPAPAVPAGTLLCVADPKLAPALVGLAAALGRSRPGPVWVVHLRPIERPGEYLRGEAEAEAEAVEAATTAAGAAGLGVEVISFASAEPGDDLVQIAAIKRPALLLMGAHRSTLGVENLGGVTGAVLRGAPCAVGILVDHGQQGLSTLRADGHAPDDGVAALAAALAAGGLRPAEEGERPDLQLRPYAAGLRDADGAGSTLLLRAAPAAT
ncbi:MAG: cation:proton antiporter [Deltaproteobacteria bacterium]|nr:cation:proton antiporter [Deltaproteobacteria bacterium]